jgi:hypothetical protein
MRINIWIVVAILLALVVVTRYLHHRKDTQRICADDPGWSRRAFRSLNFLDSVVLTSLFSGTHGKAGNIGHCLCGGN